MPSTRLLLIAHAATVATRRAAFASSEEPLSPAASAAARACRGAIPAGEALVAPAVAARRTAEALGLEAGPCPELRDLDAGRWCGAAVAELPPAEVSAWLADPDYAGHGGESLAALIERMAAFLAARLSARGTTVAVTHAAPLRAAVVAALGAPAAAFWRVEAPPLTAAVLGSDGRRWSVRGLGPLADLGESLCRTGGLSPAQRSGAGKGDHA